MPKAESLIHSDSLLSSFHLTASLHSVHLTHSFIIVPLQGIAYSQSFKCISTCENAEATGLPRQFQFTILLNLFLNLFKLNVTLEFIHFGIYEVVREIINKQAHLRYDEVQTVRKASSYMTERGPGKLQLFMQILLLRGWHLIKDQWHICIL